MISWLPGQATGFHDHGGSAGAFAVVWGTLMERRVVGAATTGHVLAKPVGAGGLVTARPPGARGIDEILASAHARLRRLTPRQAFRELAGSGVLIDIRPAAQRTDEGEVPGPSSWSATTWNGAWIPAATPGCPGSPGGRAVRR